MKTLIITPGQAELDLFAQSCTQSGLIAEKAMLGRLSVVYFPVLGIMLAPGGFGKAQFAVQTQYLLDIGSKWDKVVCAGTADGLSAAVSIGDVVVATAIVEHDFSNRFGPHLLPKFHGSPIALAELRTAASRMIAFQVHFGTLASGDEDTIEPGRKRLPHETLDALAVSWEGAGAARACTFNNVPFIEIRGITNAVNVNSSSDFEKNLELAMDNVATLIADWLGQSPQDSTLLPCTS